MRVGLAADHGGFELKTRLSEELRRSGFEIVDFGASTLDPDDDYPDFVIPLARAVSSGDVERGIAICGSGVGVAIAANKVRGVRAALCHDHYSAEQGVEDDAMNVLCLGGRVIGFKLARDLAQTFLSAHNRGEERYKRRLQKIRALE